MRRAAFVADEAPNANTLTGYDEEHLVIYLRLLDAEADGAEWDEAALLVLSIAIRYASRPERTASGRAISHVPNGWPRTDTAIVFVLA
jgi:hypothetical protein